MLLPSEFKFCFFCKKPVLTKKEYYDFIHENYGKPEKMEMVHKFKHYEFVIGGNPICNDCSDEIKVIFQKEDY